jgi:hypothetical protein
MAFPDGSADPVLLVRGLSAQAGWQGEAETHLAVGADQKIVAIWYQWRPASSVRQIGYAVSHDLGAHWAAPQVIAGAPGHDLTDPVVVVDPAGAFYAAWIDIYAFTNGAISDARVSLAQMPVGADQFGPARTISDAGRPVFNDKPWMVMTPAGALVSWHDVTDSTLAIARVSDGSVVTAVAADAHVRSLPALCTDPAGSAGAPVHLVYLLDNGVGLSRSIDGGAHWKPVPGEAIGGPAVGGDPTCVSRGEDVWVTYWHGVDASTDQRATGADGVRMVHSGNGGATFDAEISVANASGPSRFLYPQIALSASGALDCVFVSGVEGGGAELVRATSRDRGGTWLSHVLASGDQLVLEFASPSWPGDYLGATISAGALLVVFGDNATGSSHVSFARAAAP